MLKKISNCSAQKVSTNRKKQEKVLTYIRIQNGLGIETIISNEETSSVIQDFFIPSFREGDYFKGTYLGISRLIQLYEERK